MKKILLCSSNPILIKSLYGTLRDEGHQVETIEHPAFAVQSVMKQKYDFLIMDSEPFGLSSEDAAEIIKMITPEIQIFFLGKDHPQGGQPSEPLDLAELKRTILGIAV